MLTTSTNNTEAELEMLAHSITEAISKVQEGTFISLTLLEKKVDSICEKILKLPAETAKTLASKLEDIVKDLDTLRKLMMKQLTALRYKNRLTNFSR
tara:strand:- start:71 stop:361 length:291 start_codon:yes stop_codon:yes gene_type:complete